LTTPYFVTTHSGMESIVIREMADFGLLATFSTEHQSGYVQVNVKSPSQLFSLKTIHHVLSLRLKAETTCPWTLDMIRQQAGMANFEELNTDEAGSMRVTAFRHDKTLPFTSEQVELEVADVILNRYPYPVRMKCPTYTVRVDVHQHHLMISLQLTPVSLSKRRVKPYSPVTAMKSSLANAMLMMGDLSPNMTLLDPFVGSGTLLLQAYERDPTLKLHGIDYCTTAIEGLNLNLQSEGVLNANIIHANSLQLSSYIEAASIDRIITDPPYGVRTSKHKKFFEFYLSFLAQARRVLKPGGLLVMILVKRRSFDDALSRINGFEMKEQFQIKLGGFTAHIVKLCFIGQDSKQRNKGEGLHLNKNQRSTESVAF
jgi:tRNA (guanine6-N2)-methyltransferase